MKLPDGNVLISFSGGRTSGYMLHRILEANGDLPDRVKVLFANTGREMPRTLDFVHNIEKNWDVNITWLEYSRAPSNRYQNGKAHFQTVSWDSAAREGEPFDKYLSFQHATKCIPKILHSGVEGQDYASVSVVYWVGTLDKHYRHPCRRSQAG